ncbi:MAG TPA: hypothetical protein VNM48_01475 [Chloroflexota bacterium]|nr:hypothetical protein [Chloroflexota bacterium]
MDRKLGGLICLFSLVGCATKQVTLDEALPAPADRVFAYAGPTSETGPIRFIRDGGLVSGGCPMGILVDGKVAAHLRVRETITLHVPGGSHILGVMPTGAGLCSYGAERYRKEMKWDVRTGEMSNMRVGLTQDGEPFLTPTAF